MTQADLPQISLQRYVDLLKRRRWQVIPVSLVGLLLGGLVAFFIPRYYVAQTLLVHRSVPGQEAAAAGEDPFASLVETARSSIPLVVGETMRKLGWPEALVRDPFELTENQRAVRSRLQVFDLNATKKRDYAQLLVTFRDQDGQRAAAFLNTLVEIWTSRTLQDLRGRAEQARAAANDAYARQNTAYVQLLEEKLLLERQYGIDPSLDPAVHRERENRRGEAVARQRAELVEKQAGQRTAAAQLREVEAQLQAVPRRVPPDRALLQQAAQGTEEGKRLFVMLAYQLMKLENLAEGNPERAATEREIAKLQSDLEKLVAGSIGGADAEGRIANPAWTALDAQRQQLRAAVARLEAEVTTLEQALVKEEQRLLALQEGWFVYQRKVAAAQQAQRELDRLYEQVTRTTAVRAALDNEQTVRQEEPANPPPRPTEPNVLVVALIGCVLGLGIAIALILLLDLLQASFKTVDDVERALPVPVLGGMSHLETREERLRLVRRRRRNTLLAAAFLLLCTAVVTLFYVDPTRLPPAVRNLLALVLGS